jgi:hypothetical protein
MLELQRGVRLRMQRPVRSATSPEKVDAFMPELLALVRRIGRPLVVSAVPKTPEEIERIKRSAWLVARNEPARTIDPPSAKIPPPIFQEEVTELLANSGSFEERRRRRYEAAMRAPPEFTAADEAEAVWVAAAEKARKESLARKSDKALADAIARLRALVERNQRK